MKFFNQTPCFSSLMALVILTFMLGGCTPHSTGPTEVGVRTIKFSIFGKKGVEPKVYEPGSTYFFVPFLSDWHTFDTRLQNLEMTAVVNRGDQPKRDDLLFKTIDGNDISLDVIISYRINPASAPLILQQVARSDEELKDNLVRVVARSKPRDIFGELNTEEFYISAERSKKADQAAQEINEILGPYGIVVERVGTRDYRFSTEYQRAIEEKKIADQQTEKFKATTRAVEQENIRKVEQAKGEIAKIRAKADGEYERTVIQADVYLEQKQRTAEAIEAEGIAKAEAIRQMNLALAGSGGATMVKLDIARALKDKKIILLPVGGGGYDIRTTDINGLLMNLYGLNATAAPAAKQ